MRRFLLFVTVGLLIAAFYFSSEKTIAAESPQQLAAKAKAVLKNRCFGCHGESGANEGGFNYSLNRKRLVRELIVPGNTDESKLFQRVVKGEMPPGPSWAPE